MKHVEAVEDEELAQDLPMLPRGGDGHGGSTGRVGVGKRP